MAKTRSIPIVVLRLLATGACFAAAIIMATSHEIVTVFGITVDAKYQYTPAFKFLAISNAIISAYSLLVLFVPPTNTLLSRVVIKLDVLVAMLLTASLAAAGAVSDIGKRGNEHAGWMPICDQVPRYCHEAMYSIICSIAGVLLYTAIALYGIYAALRDLY